MIVAAPDKGATNDFLSRYYAALTDSSFQRCSEFPCSGDNFCVFKHEKQNTWDRCEQLEDFPVWHPVTREGLKKTFLDVSRHFNRHRTVSSFGRKFVCEHYSWTAAADIAAHELRMVWASKWHQVHRLNSSRWNIDSSFANAKEFLYDYYKLEPIF